MHAGLAARQAPAPKVLDNPQEAFREFLSSRGLRITTQRLVIFETAYAFEGHYTADQLLENARKADPSISRATVYRCLPLCVESGYIREVDVGKDYKYYTSARNQRTFQAQVICQDTDEIFQIDAPFMEWYAKAIAEKLGMEPVSQRLQVVVRKKAENPNA